MACSHNISNTAVCVFSVKSLCLHEVYSLWYRNGKCKFQISFFHHSPSGWQPSFTIYNANVNINLLHLERYLSLYPPIIL